MSEAPASVIEPVKQLVAKYRSEFESVYDNVRQQSLELSNELQQYAQHFSEKLHSGDPQLRQQGEDIIKALQNMEPVEQVQSLKLLDQYSWIALLQLTVLVASTLSAHVLHPIVGLVLNGFSAFVLSFALLPYLAYLRLRKLPLDASADDKAKDKQARYELLAFALAEGLLSGFLLANRRIVSLEPLAFLTSLGVALASQVLSGLPSGHQRSVLLGGCVGAGLAAQLALGFLLGQLSVPYVLLSLLYAGIAYSALQLQIQHQSALSPHIVMIGFVVATLFAEAFVVVLFGLSLVSKVVPLAIKEKIKEKLPKSA